MKKSARNDSHPGYVLRAARIDQGLSLRALAARIGLPFSTLSKLENGKMALTYDKLVRLAQGLNVDIGSLVSGAPQVETAPPGIGRRSIARAGGMKAVSAKHSHFYPATELLGKMMVPIIIDVKAQSVEELGGLVRHSGEEYLYVLSGSMELHSDLYAPLPMGPGDSVYFDSGMAHGYVRTSAACRVLSVCAGAGMERFAQSAAAGEDGGRQHG
jgi:transcriptional regulator with XRE-family HTH domain